MTTFPSTGDGELATAPPAELVLTYRWGETRATAARQTTTEDPRA